MAIGCKRPYLYLDRGFGAWRIDGPSERGLTYLGHVTSIERRPVTRLLAIVLTAFVSFGALDLGHLAWDDPACDPVPTHHDHAAHRFSANTQWLPISGDHCYLCHSLRLLHAALAVQRAALAPRSLSIRARLGAVAFAGVYGALSVPSRAPPVASL